MNRIFTLNGKDYILPELDFNMICDLEAEGISLTDIDAKPMNSVRAFVGIALGSKEQAGNEIEKHLIGGGSLTSLLEAITGCVEDSGFFQGMKDKPLQKTQARTTKTTK